MHSVVTVIMIGYRFFCGEIVSRLYDTHRPIVLTRRLIKFDRVLVKLRIDFVTLRRTTAMLRRMNQRVVQAKSLSTSYTDCYFFKRTS